MRAQMRRIQLLLVACVFLMACAEPDGPTCAVGTVEKDGKCVASGTAPTCGTGTVLDNGVCVATANEADTAQDAEVSPESDVNADVAVDTTVEEVAVAKPCKPACTAGLYCDFNGVCQVDPAANAWQCTPAAYDDGAVCDCDCGQVDPDCSIPGAPVANCGSGTCSDKGECVACKPKCSGKTCGVDGCGGSCGSCSDPATPYCEAGVCKAGCTPACNGKTCGPNGCGGVCGVCKDGKYCSFGYCALLPAEDSCAGNCGASATSGCGCNLGCKAQGNCCQDLAAVCGCLPDCVGKVCGDDSCGGQCGTCAQGKLCASGQCQTDLCNPDPCAGNGTCAPATGTCTCKPNFTGKGCSSCAAGFVGYPVCTKDLCADGKTTCNKKGKCVPTTGGCDCDAGFGGAACEKCAGAGTWPSCTDPCKKLDCNDDNVCTNDSCVSSKGCVYSPNAAPCDDGDACTGFDTCAGKTCKSGATVCTMAVNALDDKDDGLCNNKHCSLREAMKQANLYGNVDTIGFAVDGTITLTGPLPLIESALVLNGPAKGITIDGGGKHSILRSTTNLAAVNLVLLNGVGQGGQGGGAWQKGGQASFVNVRWQGCAATNGAGLYAATPVTLSGCTFANNSAKELGGAVYLAANATVTGSTFSGNKSGKSGGAVWAGAALLLGNVTLAANSAGGQGSGLWSSGAATLRHCTWTGNKGASSLWASGVVTLQNNVIAGGACVNSGSFAANVANLIEDGSCNATWKGPAGLLPLANNGGAVWTCGLKASSPAREKGDSAACYLPGVQGVDAAGVLRPQGAKCDLGAFEANPDLCAGKPCNGHGACAKATGKCSCGPKYQGETCDKCAQGYTQYPQCVPDKCAGKQKPCNGYGACQPVSGACVCAAGFTGDACEKCTPGNGTWPKCDKCATKGVCDDANSCTIDSCKDGVCTNKGATDGTTCDDGDKCTTGEVCSAKTCKNGTNISCDDGELCTADSCDAKQGCVNAAAKDGAVCGGTGTCSKGVCSCGKCFPLGSEKKPAKSCKEIIGQLPKSKSGAYWLQPTGVAKAFKVYCDMTTAGGGWVLVMQVQTGHSKLFGYGSSYWTNANTTPSSPPLALSSVNAKYATFNTFPTTDGQLMLRDKSTNNYSVVEVPGMKGGTLLNRFQSPGGKTTYNLSQGVTLKHLAGKGSTQELMGFAAPTTMCSQNKVKWRMNMLSTHSGVRIGNDVASNKLTTDDASTWPCYNNKTNLSYSGVGGTLEDGARPWQDGYGSEALSRYRHSGGTGQGSQNGVELYVR